MGTRKNHNGGMNTREMNLEALELRHEMLRVKQPSMEKNLLASLSDQGQQSPVIAVQDGDRMVIIDGHKRVRALKRLKAGTVEVMVWEMPEAEALAAHYRLSAQGSRNSFEEGWLIETLHRSFGWTLGEIGKKLLKSKSWVSRRLSLVEECPAALAEAVLNGRVGVHAVVAYLVPLRRRNTPEARVLVEKLPDLDLADREIRAVVTSFGTAGAEVRKKIAEDPVLYLKAREATQTESFLNDMESRCVKNLTIVGNICVGLVKSLPEALPTEAESSAREAIQRAWAGCEEKFLWLKKTAATVLGAPCAG
jgi:ParB family chromosome partitioning protein